MDRVVAVAVLGKIERSPRMLRYVTHFSNPRHLRLKAQRIEVISVSNSTEVPRCLQQIPSLRVSYLPEITIPQRLRRTLLYPIALFLKISLLFYPLIDVFTRLPKKSLVIIQNPPLFPILVVAAVVGMFKNFEIVVDWHNYGYTLLNVDKISKSLAKFVEFKAAKLLAHHHVCVSKTMQRDLATRKIDAHVMYDRPSRSPKLQDALEMFKRHVMLDRWIPKCRNDEDITDLITKPRADIEDLNIIMKMVSNSRFLNHSSQNDHLIAKIVVSSRHSEVPYFEETPISRVSSYQIKDYPDETFVEVKLKEKRPAVVVTSSSFTPDEDIGMFIDALKEYDSIKSTNKHNLAAELPDLLVVLTGDGPGRESVMKVVAESNFTHVSVYSIFVTSAEYLPFLSSADIGVCLHLSSSSVDLPMKLVDMQSVGLAALAYGYEALETEICPEYPLELFYTSGELCKLLVQYLRHHTLRNGPLEKRKDKLRLCNLPSDVVAWKETFQKIVLPKTTKIF